MKKKSFLTLIITIILVFFCFTAIHIETVLGTTDYNYTFEANNLFNYTTPVYEDYFNIRNKTTHSNTNIFNATYSFTEETDETGTDISFIDTDTSGADTEIIVINSIGEHDEVLAFTDDSGANSFNGVNNINNEASGTIEFWMRTTDSSKTTAFYIQETSFADSFNIYMIAGDFRYFDVGWEVLQSCSNNQWYHIRIDFEGSAGGYLGLAVNTMNIHINGYLYNDLDSRGDPDLINEINILSEPAHTGYATYFDAIGRSWNGYNIDNNLFAFNTTINNTTKEVDKWEFAYSDFPTQYAIGSDVFSDWTEDDTGDHINIVKDHNSLDGNPSYYPDRKIELEDHIGSGADIGIEREFNILDGILNITWSLNFTALDGVSVSEITTEIYSNDDTLIAQIYLETGDICYKDGGEVILKSGIIQTGEIYDFNLYFNSNHNLMILSFSIDGTHYDNYIIPSLDPSKKGLGKIVFINYHDPPRQMIVYLDNIGIYSNGTSISTEPAFRQIDLDEFLFHNNWFFNEYSLLYLNLTGETIGLHLTDWYFYTGATTIEELIPARLFNGIEEIFNIAEQTHNGNDYIYTPKLWLEFYGEIENSTEIRVNGIALTDGTHDYIMKFTSQNIKINESYFYVVGDQLRYSLTFNDNNPEYIQATFNIPDLVCYNYSYNIKAYKTGSTYGYFILSYNDATSSTLTLPVYATTLSNLLPQEKILDTITFLITDQDTLNQTTSTGYFENFNLIYMPNAGFSILTINLMNTMIAILILFLPSFALYKKFGKAVIVPMMMFMSIICFATELIPLWIFFIILLGGGTFLFMKRRGGET